MGEKYVSRSSAASGTEYGDDEGPYVSDERDIIRWASWNGNYAAPKRDEAGPDSNLDTFRYGSAHPSGFGVALCDGSVRWITYSITEETHRRLINRRDGQVVTLPD